MEWVKEVLSTIFSLGYSHFGYLTNQEGKVELLKDAVVELRGLREDVQRKVDYAERDPHYRRTNRVERWLGKAEAIEGEASELEIVFEGRRNVGYYFFGVSNVWKSYQVGKSIVEKIEDVAKLTSTGNFDAVATKIDPVSSDVMPCPRTVGMDSTLEKIQSWLIEDDVGIVGVWGMGGVGKTTLLKRIHNEFLHRTRDFDVVIWIVVSQQFSVPNIQRNIGKKLGLYLPEDQDERDRAQVINTVLSSKKYFLLLDDIWAILDIVQVGIPYPNNQNMSKVLFTTRSEELCGGMAASRKIKVECLEWEDAWDLFREKVGDQAINSHPHVQRLAEEVAKECDGLPLALITVGEAMKSKETIKAWEYAKTELSKSASNFPGMEEKVLSCLKFSYDSLSTDTMKSCFLYCSLFPEDESIKEDELIGLWIAEGFIDEYDDIDEARNKGHYLIGALKSACLLEDGSIVGKDSVKMHYIIRDLALWIASEFGKKKNKFLVRAGIRLTEAPEVDRWKEAEKVSLMRNKLEALTESPNCPNLLTLNLQCNVYMEKISNNFFHFMPFLRVLDLSDTGLLELPIGIGELVELQYLNLSWTKIEILPREIENLVKLKHLDLSYTHHLKTNPHEVIRRLPKLEVLDVFFSGYKKFLMAQNVEGFDLAELEALKHLTSLGIHISTVDSLNKLLGSQIFHKCTRKLGIIKFNKLIGFELSSTFQNMKNVCDLVISDCHNLKYLVISEEAESNNRLLPRLESLFLGGLERLHTILAPRGCLQNLRSLHIMCPKLMNITWIVHLQSLQRIELWNCLEMEEVIGDGVVNAMDEELIVFPNLKSIIIRKLPKLKSICRQTSTFPSLKHLIVIGCPELKKLPVGLQNTNKTLRVISGEKEWWDKLEWGEGEDEVIKSAFLPYFIEHRVGRWKRRSP